MGIRSNTCDDGEYICTLSKELQQTSEKELRENESIRKQSIDQMREWIAKNPSIKNCRTDPKFLLRFLRTKKFSVPLACEILERYIIIRKLYPQWFTKLDCDDKDLEALIDSGYIVPLLKKHDGKQVILSNAEKFDPYKFTAAHMVRIHSLVTETLMDDEENQINGYIYINDVGGFQMAHVSLWSLKDVRNILRCVQNSSPMRHKENHFLNMSTGAAKLVEFALSLLSDKLKNRTFVVKSLNDLHDKIDPKILPKEYGGEVPLSEMISQFKKKLKECREQILALDDMDIEIDEKHCKLVSEMNEELNLGLEGTFKQLQVD